MPEEYLRPRLEALRSNQNPDGGWAYFPGKRSWLEPTAYALLALHEEADSAAWQKGWRLLRSWQREDGAWQANGHIPEAHWSTALAVTLHCVHRVYDDSFRKGVAWLLASSGAESRLFVRLLSLVGMPTTGHDPSFRGWPWRPQATAWIEPTAHTLVALKRAAPQVRDGELSRRIVLGEGMILRRRCSDGGWNYGSKAALGIDLPSYPETTALALLGLQENRDADLAPALRHAHQLWQESRSRWSRAWLAISLQAFGTELPAPSPDEPVARDLILNALEVLAAPGGGFRHFRPEGNVS
jgi:hypothetical protein